MGYSKEREKICITQATYLYFFFCKCKYFCFGSGSWGILRPNAFQLWPCAADPKSLATTVRPATLADNCWPPFPGNTQRPSPSTLLQSSIINSERRWEREGLEWVKGGNGQSSEGLTHPHLAAIDQRHPRGLCRPPFNHCFPPTTMSYWRFSPLKFKGLPLDHQLLAIKSRIAFSNNAGMQRDSGTLNPSPPVPLTPSPLCRTVHCFFEGGGRWVRHKTPAKLFGIVWPNANFAPPATINNIRAGHTECPLTRWPLDPIATVTSVTTRRPAHFLCPLVRSARDFILNALQIQINATQMLHSREMASWKAGQAGKAERKIKK